MARAVIHILIVSSKRLICLSVSTSFVVHGQLWCNAKEKDCDDQNGGGDGDNDDDVDEDDYIDELHPECDQCYLRL